MERSSASCCNSGAKKVNVVAMLTQTDSVQAREIKLCINKELHFYLNMGRQLDLWGEAVSPASHGNNTQSYMGRLAATAKNHV